MKFEFLDKLNMPKKADPERVHRHHVRSRRINISPKLIVAAFAALVVLVAAVSAVVVIKEKDKPSDPSASESTGESAASVFAPESLQSESFTGNILLAFTREGNQDLHFLEVVNFSDDESGIKVSYIPVSTVCKINKIKGTMKEHLENGGITELLWAVGERYSISIEKYILFDEKQFTDIMKYLGDTDIVIEDQINHDYNGVSFIIEEGAQTFAADTMLKYYLYLCDCLWDDQTKLTNMTASIAKRIFDYEDTTVEKRYNDIVNHITTDISAIDAKQYEKAIYNLAVSGSMDKIEITSDPSDFKIKRR